MTKSLNHSRNSRPHKGDLIVSCFESVDGDEVFFKIKMKPHKLQEVACRLRWPVKMDPVHQTNYLGKKFKSYPREDDLGRTVPMYLPHHALVEEICQGVSDLDHIFILRSCF